MAAFGAGNLKSYMEGGSDEGDSYSTTSSYANNFGLIFLYVAAGAICMMLLGPVLNGGSSTTGPSNGGQNGSSVTNISGNNDNSNNNGGSSSSSENQDKIVTSDMLDAETIYGSLIETNINVLLDDLSQTSAWVSSGDPDLVLKVLEKKTYDNSMVDKFDVEVTGYGSNKEGEIGEEEALKLVEALRGNSSVKADFTIRIRPLIDGNTRISKIVVTDKDGKKEVTEIAEGDTKKKKFELKNIKLPIKEITVYDKSGASASYAGPNITNASVTYNSKVESEKGTEEGAENEKVKAKVKVMVNNYTQGIVICPVSKRESQEYINYFYDIKAKDSKEDGVWKYDYEHETSEVETSGEIKKIIVINREGFCTERYVL
ncbi:MAG: hypothetical protein J6Y29_03165 [Clostridiales bacterium]|nr:hypothetical protein [Clostridiales bacterium]